MIDRPADGLTAMARTTALTCAAVARWMLVERPSLAGVIPPEVLGRDAGAYEAILTDLARHGIHLNVES
jgi:saccharopine dehydrogenase-like NADP-dependent oxidoreductase